MKPKKKGRPPKNRIPPSTPPKPIILDSTPITYSRSHRRNPKYFKCQSPEDDDDDDERTEKKVKLVVRLPQSDENARADQKRKASHSRDHDSASDSGSESPETDSGSGSEPESEDRLKKRKINAVDRGSDGAGSIKEKKVVKATDNQKHGSPLESGPTTPLPDKKLLVFILDRLQKKDSYGVFSEPVDVDELPDYFEVVEHPMDFGTVRKKLNRGAYTKLEELEADVFLICSNAMLYNAADTVYYRQARTIQDLAKRDFENLRHEGDNGEPQPKVVRRGRPPNSKNQKKTLETSSPSDRVAADLSSAATPTSAEDKATGSNSYNLRKGPALYRYRSNDLYVSPYRSRNGENYSDLSGDWNEEFPASILRADMKYGKKQFNVDENRRDTYTQLHPHSSAINSSVLTNSMGDMKRLVMVGLQEPLAYARSLARFAATLGPTAWKVASKKIEYTLPPGTQYGPGWVAETAEPPSSSHLPHGISEEMVEAVRKLNSRPFPQNHMYQRNGVSSYDAAGVGTSRLAMPMEGLHTVIEEEARLQEVQSAALPQREAEMWTFGKSSWPAVPPQHGRSLAVPPDLNVRVPAASPSSSLQIGSPHRHPDLALQL